MHRSHIARPAALFWGAVVFMPVGLNYLAALWLLVSLLAAGNWRERGARLRANLLWWPVVAYVAWTLIVLAIEPHYPETASNLWHGLRIAATLLMALALTRNEALWALRGFLVMALASLVMVLLYRSVGFPVLHIWHDLLILSGNKSISDALLLSVLGATTAVGALAHLHGRGRLRLIVPGFAVTAATMVVVTLWLPSRTSLLALVVAVLAACVHQWRRQLRVLAGALAIGVSVVAVLVWQAPSVQQKFEQGVHEVEAADAGAVSEGSWVVRFYMYRETARMMLDKPLAGWGIGAWNSEWRRRGPPLLANYNMPHNDFLWMGAQAGVPGFVTLLVIMLAGIWQGWRRSDLTGRLAFVAMLMMLVATSVNSATRDAAIGLSLLWVAALYLRLASEPGEPWRELVPRLAAPSAAPGHP